jgi:cell division protease FtsH
VELDGFDANVGVILMAATNRPEILDPALMRPGRFDRQVLVDRPDKAGRVDILKIYLGKSRNAGRISIRKNSGNDRRYGRCRSGQPDQ